MRSASSGCFFCAVCRCWCSSSARAVRWRSLQRTECKKATSVLMARSRYIIIAVLVLVLAGAGYAYWRRGQSAGDGEYVTEAVERGAIASTVSATGTVNPVTTVQVGTYVSGPIQALYADFNSMVKKGQLVAKIDPAPFQVKVLQAEADVANSRAKVEKDRADLQLKKLTLERNRELLKKHLISQNDVDTAKSNYD